jgi:hypothetical protein
MEALRERTAKIVGTCPFGMDLNAPKCLLRVKSGQTIAGQNPPLSAVTPIVCTENLIRID